MANGVPARTLVQRQYRAHEHEARDDQATSTVMSAKGTWKGKVPDQPKGPPVQRETQAGIDPTVKAGIGFTNGVGTQVTTAIEEQLNKLPPIAKRKLVRSMKARFMRDLSERNFQLEDLLQIFGLAIKAKMLERPTRHQMPGKHYGSSHNQRANPTCTKFVRSCIRHSGKESQYSRELYKLLTGLQYGGEADAN